MKKTLCLILAMLLLLPMLGCTEPEPEIREPVKFYFRQTSYDYTDPGGVISSETVDAYGFRQDYEYLLNQYLKGPTDPALSRVVPKTVDMISLHIKEDEAHLVLSDFFAILTGMDLTIACACLTLTVCEMTGVKKLTVSTPNALLDGSRSITMRATDITVQDGH